MQVQPADSVTNNPVVLPNWPLVATDANRLDEHTRPAWADIKGRRWLGKRPLLAVALVSLLFDRGVGALWHLAALLASLALCAGYLVAQQHRPAGSPRAEATVIAKRWPGPAWPGLSQPVMSSDHFDASRLVSPVERPQFCAAKARVAAHRAVRISQSRNRP